MADTMLTDRRSDPARPGFPGSDTDALESLAAGEILRRAFEHWGGRVALGTSFQLGGMVLLDLAARMAPGLRVLTVDTGRLPAPTYALIEKVRARYGIDIEIFFPDSGRIERMVRRHGPNLFLASPEKRMECCAARKTDPFRRALAGLDAWITGARRDQTASRAALKKIDDDPARGGIIKIAPLADWSEDRLWRYVRAFDVPYNELYDQGYRSIGCAPCTRAVHAGEDARAGRWWWEADHHKECGLHLRKDRAERARRTPDGGT